MTITFENMIEFFGEEEPLCKENRTTLGCGKSIIVDPVTPMSYIAGGCSEIRVESFPRRVLFREYNNSLFEFLQNPMIEIFSKLYETISPDDVFELYKNDSFLTSVRLQISMKSPMKDVFITPLDYMSIAEKENLSPIEVAFLYLMDKDSKGNLNADTISAHHIELVRDHTKAFLATTFDSVDKVMAILHPWNMQLGEENLDVMLRVQLDIEKIELMKNDPELWHIFKKFCVIIEPDEISDDTMVSELTFSPSSENSITAFRSRAPYLFFNLPIFYTPFRERFQSLNLEEAKILGGKLPKDLPVETFMKWMEHQIDNINYKRTQSSIESIGETMSVLYHWFFIENGVYDIFKVPTFNLIEDNLKNVGYSLVAGEYFRDHLEDVSNFEDFNAVNNELMMAKINDRQSWCESLDVKDYILKKLYEEFGAKRTVDLIMRVVREGEILSMMEWLAIIREYEYVCDNPVSWWRSLLSE